MSYLFIHEDFILVGKTIKKEILNEDVVLAAKGDLTIIRFVDGKFEELNSNGTWSTI